MGLLPRPRPALRVPQLLGRQGVRDRDEEFWERAAAKGKDANPYRASFLQLVGVAETDERAEAEYGPRGVLLQEAPAPTAAVSRARGYSDYKSLLNLFKSSMFEYTDYTKDLKPLRARDFIEKEFVVVEARDSSGRSSRTW